MTTFDSLKQFITVAEKNRKYVPSSAIGFRVALSIFEPELNDEEQKSLQKFKDNIEPIYLNVYRKNQSKLSSRTLLEYKRRILKIIQDFELYGNDPTKMATWNPQPRILRKEKKADKIKNSLPTDSPKDTADFGGIDSITTMSRHEIGLRPDVKAIIVVPYDLKKIEASRIKKFVEYLENTSE